MPVPYANLTNPQTLNLYAMVSDNPETFNDLDGHGCGLSLSGSGDISCENTYTVGGVTGENSGTRSPQTTGDGQPPSDSQAQANEISDQQNQAQQQNTSTVIVAEVKSDEKSDVLGHVVIGINGATPVGLVPDSDKAAAKALAKEVASSANGTPEAAPVAGHVEALAKNRTFAHTATLHVTPDQAKAMLTAIKGMAGHQMYDPAYRNCASFVEEVLRSGGVKAPSDVTPGGLVGDLKKQFPQ